MRGYSTKDLIKAVMAATGEKEAVTARIINATFEAIPEMAQSNPVTIRNFGRFMVVATKERPVRNPLTGEALTLPAGKRFKFRAKKGE
jgi:DNA-binding protein HU-beta